MNDTFIDLIAQMKILGVMLSLYLSLMTILNPLLSLANSTSKICLESILLFLFLPISPYLSGTTETASGLSNLKKKMFKKYYLFNLFQ